jgi:hypothetical protein
MKSLLKSQIYCTLTRVGIPAIGLTSGGVREEFSVIFHLGYYRLTVGLYRGIGLG